jgi:TonB family protein
MPPIAKENELLTATPDARPTTSASTTEPANKPQPVALEVPVTVNGARTVEGSDKREPFSEATSTVLIFGNGGVIRLASSVAPGQLLFLTNEKTKKEVVCQVVKSKNYRNVSGYVELEFTEPVVGFWGMRFPGDRLGPAVPQAVPASPAASGGVPVSPRPVEPKFEIPSVKAIPSVVAPKPPAPVVVAKAPEPKLAEAKFVAPAPLKVQEPVVQAPIVPAPPLVHASPVLSRPEAAMEAASEKPLDAPFPGFDLPRTSEAKASIFAPSSQATGTPSTFSATSLPSVPEVQPLAPPPPPVAHVPAAADPETEALKQHTARLQEQLSTLLFEQPEAAKSAPPAPVTPPLGKQPVADVAAKVLEFAKMEPLPLPVKPAEPAKLAPPLSKSSLEEEELKIPSWLEPLARNAAAPVSTQELIEREKAKRLAEKAKNEEAATEVEPVVQDETVSVLQVPNFGSGLAIDESTPEPEPASGSSGKGLLFAAIAAGVLLVVAGGWWFMNRQTISSPSSAAQASTHAVQAPAPAVAAQAKPHVDELASAASPAQTNPAPQSTAFSLTNPGSNSSSAPANASSVAGRNQQVVKNSQKDAATIVPASEVQPVPAAPKKPALGDVRFATPTVTKHQGAQDSTDSDPGLALSADQPESTDESLGTGLAVASKGPAAPAAPLPVGGAVVQAQLLSRVAPVYPQLAKNQHISGDVKIDALIDANGRVTTMKIVSGPTLLHQAAMDSLKQWKYQPAALDGKPVSMHLTVTIQFRLQ